MEKVNENKRVLLFEDKNVGDFLLDSTCKNCVSYDGKKSYCSLRQEQSYDEGHCSYFEKTTISEGIIDSEEELSELITESFSNPFLKAAVTFIKENPLFYDRSGLWWSWSHENFFWEMVDETDLLNAHDKIIGIADSVNSSRKSAILESLRRVARLQEPLEVRKDWVQFGRVIVDLKTGREFSASPKYFVTNPIPWSLGDSESTPVIDELLVDWVGEKYSETLKEIVAFCMVPDYPIARIFCFTGSGANGKSTFLQLIARVVGIQNVVSTELETLMSSRFEPAKLYKRLVCQLGETNFDKLSKTSLLKKLVGKDLIGGEFKNKKPFDFVNYAKIIIATNSLPTSDDRTFGFYRRWLIIDFSRQFDREVDVLSRVPLVEFENLCRLSVRLLRKNVLLNGGFSHEGDAVVRQKRYESRSDPVQVFIDDECVPGDHFSVPFGLFYTRLSKFLKDNGHRALTSKRTGMLLSEKDFDKEYRSLMGDSGGYSSVYHVLGLRLRKEEEKNEK